MTILGDGAKNFQNRKKYMKKCEKNENKFWSENIEILKKKNSDFKLKIEILSQKNGRFRIQN